MDVITPTVVSGTSGDFAVYPTVSYGQAGIIVMLVFIAGLLLVMIGLSVATWLRS